MEDPRSSQLRLLQRFVVDQVRDRSVTPTDDPLDYDFIFLKSRLSPGLSLILNALIDGFSFFLSLSLAIPVCVMKRWGGAGRLG